MDKTEVEESVKRVGKKVGAPVAVATPVKGSDRAPVFVLRADRPGHIRALMALIPELPGEAAELSRKLREFDLYEEAHR